jgi:cytochrome c oxidase subunit 2
MLNAAGAIRSRRSLRIVVLLATLTVAGCTGPFSALDPAGPAAAVIVEIWWVMLAGATVLFLLVMVLLAVAFLRPEAGRDVPGGVWLVGFGLVLPGVVLLPLTIYGFVRGEQVSATGAPGVARVDALARQWEWVFTYSRPNGPATRSVNILHIPAGQPVELMIGSADVIHSFWVPRLAGKMDAIPGHLNVLRVIADAPGVYRGRCAEFCGLEHTEMQISVHAHASIEAFEQAVASLEPAPQTDRAAPGTRR